MAVMPWQAELVTLTRGTRIVPYRAGEQPVSGKFVVLYGRAGSGKTTLIEQLATCKHTTPVLYLDIKGGAWVFSDTADIHIVPIQTYLDFSTFTNNLFGMKSLGFKSIVIDHLTELQALNLLQIQSIQPGRVSGSGFATQAQFGLSTAQLLNVIRGYKNLCETLGIHVFISVQEDARKDSVTNQIVKSGLGVTPALARSLPAMVDIVGHLTVANDPPNYTRVLNFASTAHSDAKFRRKREEAAYQIPATIAYRDEPVFVDLLNTIIGGDAWPKARYDKLASRAKVEYATIAAEPAPVPTSNSDPAATERLASGEPSDKDTSSHG